MAQVEGLRLRRRRRPLRPSLQRHPTSSPARSDPPAPWPPAACASGKTAATSMTFSLALFDYPEGFNLSLHVNFVDGGEEGEGFVFTGSEGQMEIDGIKGTSHRQPRSSRHRARLHRELPSPTPCRRPSSSHSTAKSIPSQHPVGPPPQETMSFAAPQGILGQL